MEAARAGEAGAGFAVVADEVRNLAIRAADAAKNTSELIQGTFTRVKEGTELVQRTNTAFSAVVEEAAKVGELMREIAAASKEQSEGIEQINRATAEIDKVTQQYAASAGEIASSMGMFKVTHSAGRGTPSDGKHGSKQAGENTPSRRKNRPSPSPSPEVSPKNVIPFDDDDVTDF